MAIVPMITNMISGLLTPLFAAWQRAKVFHYWRQCRRLYTFQPIYRTCGKLLAVELLTAVHHPASPGKPVSPEHYFAALGLRQRLAVIQEQLDLLQQWQPLFTRHALMVSINIDGKALQALQLHPAMQRQISVMPYLRFELVEQADRALNGPLQHIPGRSACGWMILVAGWRISPRSAVGVISISRWRASCLCCSSRAMRASSCFLLWCA